MLVDTRFFVTSDDRKITYVNKLRTLAPKNPNNFKLYIKTYILVITTMNKCQYNLLLCETVVCTVWSWGFKIVTVFMGFTTS